MTVSKLSILYLCVLELAGILLVYGAAGCNGRPVLLLNHECSPNRRAPHHTVLALQHRRLCENGCFQKQKEVDEDNEVSVIVHSYLDSFTESNPSTNIGTKAQKFGISLTHRMKDTVGKPNEFVPFKARPDIEA
ncbi:hypothetical protein NPIL_290191 [Nephila pilipes]|uniref:Uncharacterized protein n=1 Tax=Nephila pilipes TaxID=299642 RepID=A0A8X6UPP8_NEPPI|nr:hypothetical protein NPIL_290191 [Nephila pilipes]